MCRNFVVVAAIACSVAPARADRAAADGLASEAEALAGKGDLVGAAAKFRAAYAEDPRAELMCNVGIAYYKALDLPRAYRYLEQCKDASAELAADFVANVTAVIDAVEHRLAEGEFTPVQLVIEPPTATTTIRGSVFDEPFIGTRRVWLPFGHYSLVIHAEGYVDREIELDAKTREPVTTRVRLEHVAPVAPPPPRAVEPIPEPPAPPSRTPAWIASGATVGVAAVALGAYLLASHHASQANDLAAEASIGGGPGAYNQEVDAMHLYQHVSWVAAGLAGAGALASGYLWYRATRAPHVEVTASGGGATLSLGATW